MALTTLRDIVHAVGGDLYDGGRRANIPAPGHSRADRSVSLWLKDERLIVHTFGDGDWRAVLDDLRARGLLAPGARSSAMNDAASPRDTPGRRARRAVAAGLWNAGTPVADTPSEAYVRGRHIARGLPEPEALRHLAAAPVSVYRPDRRTRPALVAAIRDAAGVLTAVEVTYLTPAGRRDERLRLPRKTVGLAPSGCAVRLDPGAPDLLVAEGVCTALSACDRFGLPGWALLSAGNLSAWTPPAGVRAVLIAGDRGAAGEAAAACLRSRLRDRGLRAWVALPPRPWGDWNDWAAGR